MRDNETDALWDPVMGQLRPPGGGEQRAVEIELKWKGEERRQGQGGEHTLQSTPICLRGSS
jgi:hypothetical protein